MDHMTRRKQLPPSENGFGERLATIRKKHRLTQIELAELIDSNQRTLSHYETGAGYPPAPTIVDLAKALGVTTDELLGANISRKKEEKMTPDTKRMWNKFQQMLQLPDKDQRAVIRLINSLSTASSS